jgi:hypothetical protein
LKHQGSKSNCFYIIILIDILKTSSFGSFWCFFPKNTNFLLFSRMAYYVAKDLAYSVLMRVLHDL